MPDAIDPDLWVGNRVDRTHAGGRTATSQRLRRFHPTNIPRALSFGAVCPRSHNPLTSHFSSSGYVLIRVGGSSKLMMPVRSWSAALFEVPGDGEPPRVNRDTTNPRPNPGVRRREADLVSDHCQVPA